MSTGEIALAASLALAVVLAISLLAVRLFFASISPQRIPLPYNSEGVMPLMLPMLETARREVISRGGELESAFWSNPGTLERLAALLDRGVRVRIICGPQLDVHDGPFLRFLMDSMDRGLGLDVRWSAVRGFPHFTVIDGRYLCLEEDHTPFQPDKRGAMGTSALAPRFNEHFADLWEQAEALDRSRIRQLVCEAAPLNDINVPEFGFIAQSTVGAEIVAVPADSSQLDAMRQAVGIC